MIELKAEKRELLGKKVASLRESGFVPAELYGHGIDNVHLSIPTAAFKGIYEEAGEHSIVNVSVGDQSYPTLIHDVQKDPLTGRFLTVDFYKVKMDEKVTAHVPLVFEGESPAVANLDGVLLKAMDEIEVEALPANLPHSITVDLSAITELDHSIYVKDLPKGGDFEFTAEPDAPIASVVSPRVKEEEVVEETTPEDVAVEGREDAGKAGGEEKNGEGGSE